MDAEGGSVSLSAAGDDPEDWAGLTGCVETFAHETGWTDMRLHHAAGAFRFTQYDFLKRWAMTYIAHERGQRIGSHADTEYTDWAGLETFVDDVLASVGSGA